MSEALSKITQVNPITGVPESLIDEDEVIEYLILQKTVQVKNNGEEEKQPQIDNDTVEEDDSETNEYLNMKQTDNHNLSKQQMDFLSVKNSTCSFGTNTRVQMNLIMRQIATQFPGSVSLLKNLAQLIEHEGRAGSIPEGSLDMNMRRLDLQSSSSVVVENGQKEGGSSRMSMDNNNGDKVTSPVLDTGYGARVPVHGNYYLPQSSPIDGRYRKSHSISSLDKLT